MGSIKKDIKNLICQVENIKKASEKVHKTSPKYQYYMKRLDELEDRLRSLQKRI